MLLAMLFTTTAMNAMRTYSIYVEKEGTGANATTVSIKVGDTEVTQADGGTELTVTITTESPYIIDGVNINGLSINYDTFEELSEREWVATITMPANDITIIPVCNKAHHHVTINYGGSAYTTEMTPTIDGREVEVGQEVSLSVTPNSGYVIENVQLLNDRTNTPVTSFQKVGENKYTFTMPDNDVLLSIDYYKEGGTYAINIVPNENVTIKVTNSNSEPVKKADAEEELLVWIINNNSPAGYVINQSHKPIVTVKDANNSEVSMNEGVMVSFIMPASDVTISCELKQAIQVQNGTDSEYAVTVDGEERDWADAGETVTLTITPSEEESNLITMSGYIIDNTSPLDIEQTDENTYTFVMPEESGVAILIQSYMTLADDADNTEALAQLSENRGHNAMISGRTFFKDGAWNTICLPFGAWYDVNTGVAGDGAMLGLSTIFNGATVMELDTEATKLDTATGILTLEFKEVVASDEMPVKELQPGIPYIVKWPSGTNITNPVLPIMNDIVETPATVTSADGTVSFVGTFNPVQLNASTDLYLAGKNRLKYPITDGYTVNAFRAYFHIEGSAAAGVKGVQINFDGQPTAIHDIESAQPATGADQWYTIDGRRLGARPTAKGIYINNGKKVKF